MFDVCALGFSLKVAQSRRCPAVGNKEGEAAEMRTKHDFYHMQYALYSNNPKCKCDVVCVHPYSCICSHILLVNIELALGKQTETDAAITVGTNKPLRS